MHCVHDMFIKRCIKYLEQSLHCCECIFDEYILHDRDNFKISIMDTFIEIYKLLTHVLIETGEIDKALVVSDRGRARALSDLLETKYSKFPQYGNNVIQTYAEVDSVFHARKNEFCVLYFALQLFHTVAVWVLARQKPPFFLAVDPQGFEYRQLPISQGNNESEIIPQVVFAAYDAINVRSVLRCEDRSLDHLPESVQLIKSDDCLVRGDGQKEGDNSAPDQNEREMAPNREKNFEGNTNPLEILYSKLIAPVMQNLAHEDVVIVPDGPLHMVPFAALRDPETGLFLSEMKRIRLVPSLKTLKSLQECPSDYHSKTGALVVGAPESGAVMFQGQEITFSPLPEARREATVIGNILGVEPLLGAQATKDFIKQRLHEGVAVIHIAAHGSTKGEIVLAPGTLTGARKIPEEEKYLLTMQEVQETRIRAQLVVLSCCHSGRGEIKAEGIVGISRGFLAAGARAVVASLWGIDDEATLVFMVSFYTCLKMGKSASKSLQQAMKDVREDKDYEEPKHWAPFFLIGDDVTINFQK
ncbi:tetratricopeptide repeat protein 28-like [Actinia tenebrosa]|uniref:Tetratricopeptide repeat protein 28-like n=1 Tax=Actinia tenebrosa TaxID=6105 RepID=A0A6P8I7T7_ACTTE|nr:tetratricopeptide repeat protein 28-like [Actinia tenebrosa]